VASGAMIADRSSRSKWLPRAPRQTLYVLALQVIAVLAAMAPVYFLGL
jgi:hypothetical protein